MIIRQAIRKYVAIQGSKTRIVDDFEEHYQWMNKNKPRQAVLFFKNDWNPECSRQFTKDYVNMFKNEAFDSFIIETWTREGERTKKYYSIRYEPSFIFLSDGFELLKVIGGSVKELKDSLERVKLFRKKIVWDYGLVGGNEVWENHHEEYMRKWRDFNQQEAWNYEGTLLFDRN